MGDTFPRVDASGKIFIHELFDEVNQVFDGKKTKTKNKKRVFVQKILSERGGQRVDEDFCGALGSRRSRLDKNDPLQESERLFHHRKINISTVPRTRTATAVVGIGHVKVPHDVYTKRDEGSLVQPRASLKTSE